MVNIIGICDNSPDTICFYREAFSHLVEPHNGVVYPSLLDLYNEWHEESETEVPELLIMDVSHLYAGIVIQDFDSKFGRQAVSHMPVLLTGDKTKFNDKTIEEAQKYFKVVGLLPGAAVLTKVFPEVLNFLVANISTISDSPAGYQGQINEFVAQEAGHDSQYVQSALNRSSSTYTHVFIPQ